MLEGHVEAEGLLCTDVLDGGGGVKMGQQDLRKQRTERQDRLLLEWSVSTSGVSSLEPAETLPTYVHTFLTIMNLRSWVEHPKVRCQKTLDRCVLKCPIFSPFFIVFYYSTEHK